jgi:hypothetical protein
MAPLWPGPVGHYLLAVLVVWVLPVLQLPVVLGAVSRPHPVLLTREAPLER